MSFQYSIAFLCIISKLTTAFTFINYIIFFRPKMYFGATNISHEFQQFTQVITKQRSGYETVDSVNIVK